MNSKFDMMKEMRAEVHKAHAHSLILYPRAGGAPRPVTARVRYNFTFLGEQAGSNANVVEISDYSELKFIFWREEVPEIFYGDIVTTQWGKTYILDAEEQQDKFTYSVSAALVQPAQEGDYPYPND